MSNLGDTTTPQISVGVEEPSIMIEDLNEEAPDQYDCINQLDEKTTETEEEATKNPRALKVGLTQMVETSNALGGGSSKRRRSSCSTYTPYLSYCTVDGELFRISKIVGENRCWEGKRIDVVLVHRKSENDTPKLKKLRRAFEKALWNKQCVIKHTTGGRNDEFCFTLVHIPYHRMAIVAESLKLKLPLKNMAQIKELTHTSSLMRLSEGWSEWWQRQLQIFKRGIPLYKCDPETYAGRFTVNMQNKFVGYTSTCPENVFSDAHRTLIAKDLIHKTGRKECSYQSVMQKGAYNCSFPLHTGAHSSTEKERKETSGIGLHLRAVLYDTWATYRNMFKYQPIHLIREYFGEKTAFYFAWMGHYVTWLIFPSFVGLIYLFYGLGTYKNVSYTEEACDPSYNMLLCQTTDEKIAPDVMETLDEQCEGIQASTIFDNDFTIAFSVFMAVWSIMFIASWKRYNSELAFYWDVQGMEKVDVDRVQYYGTVERKNPVTGKMEMRYPTGQRTLKYLCSFVTTLTLCTCVIIVMVSIIIYKLATIEDYSEAKRDHENEEGPLIAAITGGILNLFAILILGVIYRKVAVVLNDWENHRTDAKYEDRLILKQFLFEFVNSYSSLFYIAFFKGKFTGTPLDPNKFFGYRAEACAPYGCMGELSIQLGIIFTGKQAFRFVKEVLVPFLHRKWIIYRQGRPEEMKCEWEKDNCLLPYPGIFREYLDMCLQYGYIMLFTAAFPVAPLIAICTNILEIRIDASRYLKYTKRPAAMRAENIGRWQFIIELLNSASILTNGAILAFTADFIPLQVWLDEGNPEKMYFIGKYAYSQKGNLPTGPYAQCYYVAYRDRDGFKTKFFYQVLSAQFAFFVCWVAGIYILQRTIAAAIPSLPRKVQLAMRKQDYEAGLALESIRLEDEDEDAEFNSDEEEAGGGEHKPQTELDIDGVDFVTGSNGQLKKV
eukprot:Nk52_evm28s238 gene=Nk52_evmTU28s238